jgi:VanZ family protein
LGPLHYLTEISWLRKRDYFANGKKDYLALVIPCLVLTFVNLLYRYHQAPVLSDIYNFSLSAFGDKFASLANIMIYLAFASALAFVIFKDTLTKAIFILVALFMGFLIQDSPSFFILFAVFLPTLIHVFLFTGLFILFGALKNKSTTGFISIVVFMACGASFFFLFPKFSFYQVSDYAQKTLISSGFALVNSSLMQIFKLGTATRENVFTSDIGFGIMRFIAFAYTYHYLNWFSKTSVIKWHKVPRRWLVSVLLIWLFSIGLYAYNYETGLMVLYFLSMLHVFLEFPLNYRSIIGIGQEVSPYAGWSKATVIRKK